MKLSTPKRVLGRAEPNNGLNGRSNQRVMHPITKEAPHAQQGDKSRGEIHYRFGSERKCN